MTLKKIILPYAIVFAGFIFLMILFSWVNLQNQKTFVREQELPSLGLAVSSKLEQRAWQYRKAGEALLEDNFISDWIQTQNSDIQSLITFMENIREKFQFDLIDASIVNDLNETYYATTGEIIQLDPENIERDGWYYTYREMVNGANLDSWFYSENDVFALYVNVPIISESGTFLGVAGGGINATKFMYNLNSFSSEHDVQFFLMRQDGALIYPQDPHLQKQQSENADSLWGASVFESIIRNQSSIGGTLLERSTKQNSIFWSMYLEEWNTYLVLERTTRPAHREFIKNFLTILLSGGLIIVFLSIITSVYVKFLWHKTITQSLQYKKTIEKNTTIRKTQDCLLRDTERYLLSRGKDTIEKSFYIQECRSALKRYFTGNFTNTANTKIILEKKLKEILFSLSTELARKNIRISTYNTDSKTFVMANESLLSLVIESLLLGDYNSENSECNVFIAVIKYNGKPSIDLSGTELTKYLSKINLDLQKFLLQEQDARIEISKQDSANSIFHIVFESEVE